MTDIQFNLVCRTVLGDDLDEVGFEYTDTYLRPRGVCIEYSRGNDVLFLCCDEDKLHMDLILTSTTIMRIDLYLWMWFNGIRELKYAGNCDEQLHIVHRRFDLIRNILLVPDQVFDDPRVCFSMTKDQLVTYQSAQRGRQTHR